MKVESLPLAILQVRLLTRGFGNSNGVQSTALFVSPALSGRPSCLRSCMVSLVILQPNDLNNVLILTAGRNSKRSTKMER